MDANLQFLNHALNAVDAKGRVSVPANFRAKLMARAQTTSTDISIHVGLDPSGECLLAHDEVAIAQMQADIEESISGLPPAERAAARRAAKVNSYSPSDSFKIDNTGRVMLSPMLRDLSGIGDLAFFVGMGDMFEIWSPLKALKLLPAGPIIPTLRYLLKERGIAA